VDDAALSKLRSSLEQPTTAASAAKPAPQTNERTDRSQQGMRPSRKQGLAIFVRAPRRLQPALAPRPRPLGEHRIDRMGSNAVVAVRLDLRDVAVLARRAGRSDA
jgi:hypothetical protein